MRTNMNCALHPVHNCGNCLFSCEADDEKWGEDCPDWFPCRDAHPSTPNVCEGEDEAKAFDLCLPVECQNCPHSFLR